MNSLGQVVMKGAINNATNNAATISLATLSAGIYLVHVVGNTTNLVHKILLK